VFTGSWTSKEKIPEASFGLIDLKTCEDSKQPFFFSCLCSSLFTVVKNNAIICTALFCCALYFWVELKEHKGEMLQPVMRLKSETVTGTQTVTSKTSPRSHVFEPGTLAVSQKKK
jgi:hypothetical protein